MQPLKIGCSVIEGGVMVSKAYGDPKYLNTVTVQLEKMIETELQA